MVVNSLIYFELYGPEQAAGFQALCDYSKYFSSTDMPAVLKRL